MRSGGYFMRYVHRSRPRAERLAGDAQRKPEGLLKALPLAVFLFGSIQPASRR
jgi:hypothetical protein